MRPNLDSLKTEIEQHLRQEGFTIFHGVSRFMDSQPLVLWDCDRHPDYKAFVATAKAAGAKLMVFHQREFSSSILDDALDQLEASDMPAEDQRGIERRLKELRGYEGFTCALELSFDYQGRVYLFDLQTEWYEDLTELLEDLRVIQQSQEEEDEDEGGSGLGGYFSQN